MSIFIPTFAGGVREMTRLGRLAHLHGNYTASLHFLMQPLLLHHIPLWLLSHYYSYQACVFILSPLQDFLPYMSPHLDLPLPKSEPTLASLDQRACCCDSVLTHVSWLCVCVCGCRSFHWRCEAHFHVAENLCGLCAVQGGFPHPQHPHSSPTHHLHHYPIFTWSCWEMQICFHPLHLITAIRHPLSKPGLYCCRLIIILITINFNCVNNPNMGMFTSYRIISALVGSEPALCILPPYTMHTYCIQYYIFEYKSSSTFFFMSNVWIILWDASFSQTKNHLKSLSHTSKPGHPLSLVVVQLLWLSLSLVVWEHTFNSACRIPLRHVTRWHKHLLSAEASAFGGLRWTHEDRQSEEL